MRISSFLEFHITVESVGRAIVLKEMTGPAGKKEFLETTFNQISSERGVEES